MCILRILAVATAVCVCGCIGPDDLRMRQFSQPGISLDGTRAGNLRAGEVSYRVLTIDWRGVGEERLAAWEILVPAVGFVPLSDIDVPFLVEHGDWWVNQSGDEHNPRWMPFVPSGARHAPRKSVVYLNQSMYLFTVESDRIISFETGLPPFFLSAERPIIVHRASGEVHRFPLTSGAAERLFGKARSTGDYTNWGPL